MSDKKIISILDLEKKRQEKKRKARLKYLYNKKMLTIVIPIPLDDRLQKYKDDNEQTYIEIFDDFLTRHGY